MVIGSAGAKFLLEGSGLKAYTHYMMRYNLDVTDDYSFKDLHSYLGITELPDLVKQAEVLTKEGTAALPDESFADRYHRAYPITSPADVYMSNAYFINKKAALEEKWGPAYVAEVESRIKQAAEITGTTKELESYNLVVLEKSAADYQEQTVASFQVNGVDYDLFPYKTAEDIVKAAETFTKNIKDYPFDWRPGIAQNFVKKAEKLGVEELPELICKYGGLYYPDLRTFDSELTRRMNKLGSEPAKQAYQACIEKSAKVTSQAEAMALCNEAYVIEKQAGAYNNLNVYRQLGDIVDKCFPLSIYKISELLNVIEMAGEPYAAGDLQKVSKDIFKQAFGVDLDPSDLQSLQDTLPTMPRSDVALFQELSGIKAL
jgi:hypothetical protein